MVLNKEDFLTVVKNAPLFSLDLVMVNEDREVLFGQRLNAPAKNWWFVPGGRIYKDETLKDAFGRISEAEIGSYLDINQSQSLGLYEHFYNDSAFSNDVSTHYINVPHLVFCQKKDMHVPKVQHSSYLWIPFDKIEENPTIHKYSKLFMTTLEAILKEINYD